VRKISKSMGSIGIVLLLGTLLSGCVSAPGNPSAQLSKRIEAARTADDHELIAKYYDGQAVASRAKADKYRKFVKAAPTYSTGGRGNSDSKARLNSIINTFESEAAEYEKLAAKHRMTGCNVNQSKTCG
jgi:hypothetical protein